MNLCEFVSIRKALFLPLPATQEWGENSPKNSRIEPMNRRKTSNTQHPTSNNQWFPIGPLIGGWMLDVGCWMFSVPKGSWGGPRRGVNQSCWGKGASSPRPSPPSDGGEGGVAALARLALLSLTFAGAAFSFSFCARAEKPVSFNEQIRPLLNTHCVKCHGGVKETGKLNLLFRDAALKGGKSGLPAVVPGKPEESEMIARLTTADEDARMPKKADPLKPEQIALLKRWIAEGAQWEEHWAYVPPKKSGRTLDDIVKVRLAKERLSLSPEADRWTLARRMSLDLTGLPPSPEQLEAF